MLPCKPEILDCTLRDGGYVIDFAFTEDEVKHIVADLSEAGVPYIEIGHGLGLGAYRRVGSGGAAVDD